MGYNCSCRRRVPFRDGSCGSHCAVHHSQECGFNFGTLAIQGPMRATSKPRSALDEEIRFSDLDFLNLTDYHALCRGTRSVFPEVRAELYAAKECRVLCARRWKRPERITGLKCEAALWTFRAICTKSQSRERQHLILLDNVSWVCASTKGRSSIWSVDLRPRELCASALPRMPVFVIGESRQSVIQQMSRHADSSIHRNTMRASVRLQTRDCPDNVCFWMSSTHRVLTATLCNESKRRRKLRALLGPAAGEAAQEQQRAANRTVKASALPPGFAFDEHWRSAPSPTTSTPRFLQPSRTSMLGRPPGFIHGTAPLDAGICGSRRKNTDHLL